MTTAFRPVAIGAICLLASLGAHAAKSCDELKGEIAAKLDAKNVKGYTLNIVAADDATTASVVGRCEGGKKKITYGKAK
jgi:hypothetical protein